MTRTDRPSRSRGRARTAAAACTSWTYRPSAMSIPTLQGLQTALSGLLAEQQALDVTGSNITNSDTEGYTRETADLQTNLPITIPPPNSTTGRGARLGTGVSVGNIARVR